MKKLLKLLVVTTVLFGLVACGGDAGEEESKTIRVSATLDPHSKILEIVKPILKEKYGYDLEITVLDDYNVFNMALDNGEVEANYFQHVPYFEGQVADNGYEIVNAGGIHIEPFGVYSKTITDISELEDGAVVVIGNSVSDHGRLLTIFEDAGLIKLDPSVAKIAATTADIVENPKNLEFKEIKPELLVMAFNNDEGSLVAINGNYAIAAGLNPLEDAVLLENITTDNPYVNIVACQKGMENDPRIEALVEVLQSEEITNFVNETYKGSVVIAE